MTLHLDPDSGDVMFPDGTTYTTVSGDTSSVNENVKRGVMTAIINDYSNGNTQAAGEAHARFTLGEWIIGRP